MQARIVLKMPSGETRELIVEECGKTIEDILVENNIAPDSVVILKDGKPIPVTEKINDGDSIIAIVAFSGG